MILYSLIRPWRQIMSFSHGRYVYQNTHKKLSLKTQTSFALANHERSGILLADEAVKFSINAEQNFPLKALV